MLVERSTPGDAIVERAVSGGSRERAMYRLEMLNTGRMKTGCPKRPFYRPANVPPHFKRVAVCMPANDADDLYKMATKIPHQSKMDGFDWCDYLKPPKKNECPATIAHENRSGGAQATPCDRKSASCGVGKKAFSTLLDATHY